MFLEGVPGEPEPLRNLADQLILFKPWGADYARHITASPPGFKMQSTTLVHMARIPNWVANHIHD